MHQDSNDGNAHNRLPPELIRLGYVSGIHGVRGAIRVRLDNADSTVLQRVPRVTLAGQGWSDKHQVLSARSAGKRSLKVVLHGITSAEQAGALRGSIVMIEVAALPLPNPREFYYFQALGCRVVTAAGLPVGIIEEVFSNGANDVWVVRDDSGEYLIPVIEDIVKELDFVERRAIIDAVPGLLDSLL